MGKKTNSQRDIEQIEIEFKEDLDLNQDQFGDLEDLQIPDNKLESKGRNSEFDSEISNGNQKPKKLFTKKKSANNVKTSSGFNNQQVQKKQTAGDLNLSQVFDKQPTNKSQILSLAQMNKMRQSGVQVGIAELVQNLMTSTIHMQRISQLNNQRRTRDSKRSSLESLDGSKASNNSSIKNQQAALNQTQTTNKQSQFFRLASGQKKQGLGNSVIFKKPSIIETANPMPIIHPPSHFKSHSGLIVPPPRPVHKPRLSHLNDNTLKIVSETAKEVRRRSHIMKLDDQLSGSIKQHRSSIKNNMSGIHAQLGLQNSSGSTPMDLLQSPKVNHKLMNRNSTQKQLKALRRGSTPLTILKGIQSLQTQNTAQGNRLTKMMKQATVRALQKQESKLSKQATRLKPRGENPWQSLSRRSLGLSSRQDSLRASFLHQLTKKSRLPLGNGAIVEDGMINSQVAIVEVEEQQESMSMLLRETFRAQIQMRLVNIQEQERIHKEEVEKRSLKNKCPMLAYKVNQSNYFSYFILINVLMNIFVLTLDSTSIEEHYTVIFESMNIYFTVVYTLEMWIKLSAIGIKNYLTGEKFNLFDAFIVIISIIDIVISYLFISPEERVYSELNTIIKAARVIRLFKLVKFWRTFEVLLEILTQTLHNIKSFFFFISIVLFIYTLVGLELFQQKAKFNHLTGQVDHHHGASPLFNFDDFKNAVTTVFVLLTNDPQSAIYYNYYRGVDAVSSTIYWITFVVFAQKILLTVFLAMLLENFENGALKQRILEKESKELLQMEGVELLHKELKRNRQKNFLLAVRDLGVKAFTSTLYKIRENKVLRTITKLSNPQTEGPESTELRKLSIAPGDKALGEQQGGKAIVIGKSLSLFSSDSRARAFLYRILTHEKYQNAVLLVILVSSIQLALDSPLLDPKSTRKLVLNYIEYVTVTIFTIEAIAKVFTFGLFLNGSSSYFRQVWNIVDFIILLFQYICLTPQVERFKVVKAFRILRSVRLVSRNEGLKVAVRALVFAIPNVINITVIMLLFFLVFAIISVSHFKGKLYYCYKPIDSTEVPLVTKWDCLSGGGLWENRPFTFDDAPNALVTLFVMATTAGWAEQMFITISTNGVDMIPDEEHNRSAYWLTFYILFMVIGCFFFLNCFIAVVINTFHSEEERVGGSELLTDKQKEYIDLRLLVLRSQPIKKARPPTQIFRQICYKIYSHRYFERFIQAVIILNTITLMFRWFRQPKLVTDVTEMLNYIFTLIFVLEAAIRLSSQGIHLYFTDGWNLYDFLVACISVLGIIISLNSKVSVKATSILRAFRLLRLLRLLKRGGAQPVHDFQHILDNRAIPRQYWRAIAADIVHILDNRHDILRRGQEEWEYD